MTCIDSMTTEELEKKNLALWSAFRKTHECKNDLVIKIRTFSSGHDHYVFQCNVCGKQFRGPLNKAKALQQLAGREPLVFDETIVTTYHNTRNLLSKQIKLLTKEIQNRLDPENFAKEKEEREIARCKVLQAEDAIDKAIEAFGKAFPWERILSLMIERIQPAIDKLKGQPKPFHRFSSEDELKEWLETWIGADFEFFKEVPGIHLTENVKVKIDYVLVPKKHLIDAGFLPTPVGLEVKYLSQKSSFSSRASRFVWQAVSYTDCQFKLPSGYTRLPRVLLFSNISFEDEYSLLQGITPYVYENEKAKWAALLELANHANVGNLAVYGDRNSYSGWKIKFAAGNYFSQFKGKYTLHNAQLFNKVRIGNF